MLATGALGIPVLSPADSAYAVAAVYTLSLLATTLLGLAALVICLLRGATVEGRVVVWRSTIVALLVVSVGRQLPLHWMAWVVPSTLALPLVELGRVQVAQMPIVYQGGARTVVQLMFAVYLSGVLLVLLPTIAASARACRFGRCAPPLRGAWYESLHDACAVLDVRRPVRLISAPWAAVPMTWGLGRATIVVPQRALHWGAAQRRIVLLHELEHVRAADWAFNLAARVVCALYWFHPGAWWVARALRRDCEIACDARVIADGVRRSDYAELLVDAADGLLARPAAMALSERAGLRARLAAVLDVRSTARPLAARWVAAAIISTTLVAGPMSDVQLAPTRGVLTTLMRDARWESRAYAVLGLAQRRDSIAVARSAAERDPNPQVRAWARYALSETGVHGAAVPLSAILRTR